jgi:hypothetical protein
MRQDARKPHDGELAQGIEEPTPGGGHPLAAEADALDVGAALAQGADQIGPVQVSARLTGADEKVHTASLPRKSKVKSQK